MFWEVIGIVAVVIGILGSLASIVALFLDRIYGAYLWGEFLHRLRAPVILFICANEPLRTSVVQYLKICKYRAIGVPRQNDAEPHLRKKSLRLLIIYLQSEDGVEEIEWSSELKLVDRNVYTLFLFEHEDLLDRVNDNARDRIRHPFFKVALAPRFDEVLSMRTLQNIIPIVEDCQDAKGRILRRLKRWNMLEEIDDATVVYAATGEWGAEIHACKDERSPRLQFTKLIHVCLHEMNIIAMKHNGIVCSHLDEGIAVIFPPTVNGEDPTLDEVNEQEFPRRNLCEEIFREVRDIVYTCKFLDNLAPPKIGIAVERITLVRNHKKVKSIDWASGPALSYAKCLAQYAMVRAGDILVYDPPLDEKHKNFRGSFGETGEEFRIPNLPFRKFVVEREAF